MLQKALEVTACNLKFANEKGEFEGYASVFNSNDRVNDTILPGAFQKSLESGAMPAMFVNHDHHAIPVGLWRAMHEDDHGLYAKGWIDTSHSLGKDLYPAMKDGRMSGMSIGFTMGQNDFDRKDDGGRTIKNVDLREVSVVTFPCEEKARITGVKREDIELLTSIKSCEEFLREAGLSRSLAKVFLGQVSRLLREGAGDTNRSTKQSVDVTDSFIALLERLK